MKKFLPLLIFGFLIVVALVVMYFVFTLSPVEATESVRQSSFLIARGASLRDISESLEKDRIIRSARAFRLLGFLTGRAHQLKPGAYELNAASATPEILSQLVIGPAYDAEVLIVEGENIFEIDAKLAERGIIEKNSLIAFDPELLVDQYPFLSSLTTLEGFLFPDTYRFSFDSSPERVVKTFLENFKKKVWPLLSVSRRDYYETLIVASLVEKEVPLFEDRQIVAGIIYKRLAFPMRLQVDATNAYVRQVSPIYDTYANDGLPPTPISNPGLEAIRAALKPQSSTYFYYLSLPKTGETLFSRTFDEHDEKRAKYLR